MLVDNGGGAIFDRLPIAAERDVYEHHVATPPGIDFAARRRALRPRATRSPRTLAELRALLAAPARRGHADPRPHRPGGAAWRCTAACTRCAAQQLS